jgi:hypothetical protein
MTVNHPFRGTTRLSGYVSLLNTTAKGLFKQLLWRRGKVKFKSEGHMRTDNNVSSKRSFDKEYSHPLQLESLLERSVRYRG